MAICAMCKYFDMCGSVERTTKCPGYEYARPDDLPTSAEIDKKIKRNADKIKRLEDDVDRLSYSTERDTARTARDIETLKEYGRKADENADAIGKACAEIELLKIENAILYDNLKVCIYADAIGAIITACAPYVGKKYGEKTAEKIRDAVKPSGFYFYFNSSYNGSYDSITICPLYDGYRTYYDRDVIAYAIDYKNPLITTDNVVNLTPDNVPRIYREYVKDTRKRAREIVKIYRELVKKADDARRVQSALNSILPEKINHINKIDTIYSLL